MCTFVQEKGVRAEMHRDPQMWRREQREQRTRCRGRPASWWAESAPAWPACWRRTPGPHTAAAPPSAGSPARPAPLPAACCPSWCLLTGQTGVWNVNGCTSREAADACSQQTSSAPRQHQRLSVSSRRLPSGIMEGMTSMPAGIWYGFASGSEAVGCGTPLGAAAGAGVCAKMEPVWPCRCLCGARLVSGSLYTADTCIGTFTQPTST